MARDPSVTRIACGGHEIHLNRQGTFLGANSSNDGNSRWLHANTTTNSLLQALIIERLVQWPGSQLAPLPATSPWCDGGGAFHYEVGEQHLWLHQRAMGMPEDLLPRSYAPQADKEAQQAQVRRAQLKPGYSLFARMSWMPGEHGVQAPDQLICTNGRTVLIHELCCGDQNEVLLHLEKYESTVRIHQINRTDCQLQPLIQSGLLSGILLDDGSLICDQAAADGRPGKVLRKLIDHGVITQHLPVNCPYAMCTGGPARFLSKIDLQTYQQFPSVTESLLSEIEQWANEDLAQEIFQKDFLQQSHVEQFITQSQSFPIR